MTYRCEQTICYMKEKLHARRREEIMSSESKSDVLYVKKLFADVKTPLRKRKDDAGWDLYYHSNEDKVIGPHSVEKFCTGVSLQIPEGHFVKIHERSSIGSKNIAVRAGVIDRSYRGELIVLLANNSNTEVTIPAHCRIAQFVCQRIYENDIFEASDLSSTDRGSLGFGSSGMF